MERNDNPYVTYKWLFATAITILVIVLSFTGLFYSAMSRALEGKADIKWVETRADSNTKRIELLAVQLDKMEGKQEKMLEELGVIKGLLKVRRD